MNMIDVSLGLILIFSMYKGYKKGFVIEIATLIALILGIYGASHFSGYVGSLLVENFQLNHKYVTLMSFVITFIIIVIAVVFVGKITERFIKMIALGFVNNVLGSVFSVAKYMFIISVLIFILHSFGLTSFVDDSTLNDSILYEPISKIAPKIIPHLKTITEEIANTFKTTADQVI